ncbi:MAG TPA: hypothetical protein PL195_02635 [bacterium]|nr:hypothetical protein [bacterium]HQJ59365.1 hypothetical protein [bacterium]
MTEKNNYTSEPSFKKFFKRPEKPSTIKSGQIWTVFPDNKSIFSDNPENTGTVVLIYEASDESAFIVPIHPYKYLRPKTDIIIKKDVHFSGLSSNELVASIHLALSISTIAFDYGVYLGEFTKKGMIETKDALKNFENILFHLALAQRKDSRNELMTDEESRNTVLAGIYDLVPVDGNLDDLIEFDNQIKDILQPWHVLAMAEMFAEEEVKQVSEVAEPEPIYNFSQKVASIIELIFNGSALGEISPMAAGEAEKADHTIPFKKEYMGMKLEFLIIIRPDKNDKKFTTISIDGKASSFVRDRNAKITLMFSDGSKESLVFDNENNKLLRIKNRDTEIISINIELN